jgi:cephalosporin hydroxylase
MQFSSLSRMLFSKNLLADPVLNKDCGVFEVNNWIISQFVVERLLPRVGFHPFPLNEQILMTAAVCRIKPTHILEWGTNVGSSARIFYEICRAFSVKSEIHSIDLPDSVCHEEHPGKQRGRMVRGISDVQLHQGNGIDVALEILKNANKPVNALFFLDGDHNYTSVRRELDEIIRNVPSANILVHDTYFQTDGSGYNIGPYLAVQNALEDNGGRFEVYSQNLGLPGMTLLLRIT